MGWVHIIFQHNKVYHKNFQQTESQKSEKPKH
jgi:hypothetical protein